MESNRQVAIVHAPQGLEDHFGLRARVYEDQRQAMRCDLGVDAVIGVARGVAGPGQFIPSTHDADIGRRTALQHHLAGKLRDIPFGPLGRNIGLQLGRTGHGCRQACDNRLRGQRKKPLESER